VHRLVAQELVLSFVPDPEQRLWRTLTRRKQQLAKDRTRCQNRLEARLDPLEWTNHRAFSPPYLRWPTAANAEIARQTNLEHFIGSRRRGSSWSWAGPCNP
jgi:hypothetical protein